jgi:putative tricarboxylic transport membrane protein
MNKMFTLRAMRGLTAIAVGMATLTGATAAMALDQVKIMAPAAPGGGWDQTARAMQTALVAAGAAKIVQVTNVTGAGGAVGIAQLVNSSKGDGNQLMVNGLVMVGALLTNKSPVTLADVTPIARLTAEYEIIVVPAASPFKTLGELMAAMKADPGKVSFAGGSAGGTDHILVGLVGKAAGVDVTKMNYVPYSGGGESVAAILGNKVSAGVSGIGEFLPHVKSGKMRALAVSSPKRLDILPDAPTIIESGYNVDLANWRAVMAPPGLTDAQKGEIDKAIATMVKSQGWQDTLKQRDWMDAYMAGPEFAAYVKSENERITDVLKTIGLVQ